jgi:hypothetical protein
VNGQSSPTPSIVRVRKSEGSIRAQWAAQRIVEPPTPFHISGLTSESEVSQG